jgi:hypothetical protein
MKQETTKECFLDVDALVQCLKYFEMKYIQRYLNEPYVSGI